MHLEKVLDSLFWGFLAPKFPQLKKKKYLGREGLPRRAHSEEK